MAAQFLAAAQTIPHSIMSSELVEAGINICSAVTKSDAMTTDQKLFHAGKTALSIGGMAVCALIADGAGVVGFALSGAEEVYSLNRIGRYWREKHRVVATPPQGPSPIVLL